MGNDSMQNALDRLKSEVEYPEPWIPEPGETLIGAAIRWETVTIEREGEESRTCDVSLCAAPTEPIGASGLGTRCCEGSSSAKSNRAISSRFTTTAGARK
jgi:hypothetical protein